MSEHYTKNTTTATAFCRKCRSFTVHRIDHGRLGPCLICVGAPLAGVVKPVPAEAGQLGLFSGAKAASAPASETKAAPAETIATPAETPDPLCETQLDDTPARKLNGVRAQELWFAQVREFVEACKAARCEYRGYSAKDGVNVYSYSRLGAPDVVFLMLSAKWDRTPAMIEREAQKLERWL